MYRICLAICVWISIVSAADLEQRSEDRTSNFQVSVFSKAAIEEIWQGAPPSALCLVKGDHINGSGVLATLEGAVFVLTAAHIKNPESVMLMVSDKTSSTLKINSQTFLVNKAFQLGEKDNSTFLQSDLQILLLDGSPDELVKPLNLSTVLDKTEGLSLYGFGSLYAEHFSGKREVMLPYVDCIKNGKRYINFLPSKINFFDFIVAPRISIFEQITIGSATFFRRFQNKFVVPRVTDKTKTLDGVIRVKTHYVLDTLTTHVGEGFSGGPVLQEGKVVAICVASDLQGARQGFYLNSKIQGAYSAVMGCVWVLGIKVPFLKSVAAFAGNPLYALLNLAFGYLLNVQLTNGQLCLLNATSAALSIAWSLYKVNVVRETYQSYFLQITDDIVDWIRATTKAV